MRRLRKRISRRDYHLKGFRSGTGPTMASLTRESEQEFQLQHRAHRPEQLVLRKFELREQTASADDRD
jgi:hypothetical protein